MKNSRILKCILFVSGLIAIGIGGAILFVPATFFAPYGIEPGSNANLASELRAGGGALLAIGLLIMAGVFVAEFALASTVIATAVYLSYGLARLLSMALDGWPDDGLAAAAAVELVVGTACLLALLRYRNPG